MLAALIKRMTIMLRPKDKALNVLGEERASADHPPPAPEETPARGVTAVMERRLGQRLPLDDLHLTLGPDSRRLPVMDVGCRGLGVRRDGWPIAENELLRVDLYLDSRPLIKNLQVRVARTNGEAFGCVYDNLTLLEAGKIFRLATMLRRRATAAAQKNKAGSSSGLSFLSQD